MKSFFTTFIFLFFLHIALYAQKLTQELTQKLTLDSTKMLCDVWTEKKNGTFHFYVKNTYLVPQQIYIIVKTAYNIEFMNKNVDNMLYGIVPSQQEKFLFASIKLLDSVKKKGFNYVFYKNIGNPDIVPDTNFVYMLPYEVGTKRFVMQGYNGRFSHKNQFALDFKMRVGTPIHAARGGVVIEAKNDSDKRGRSSEFAKFGNFINILHPDGTYAIYYHLKKDGVLVNIGDTVAIGQKIGFSGNTGWSTGPHLHFSVKKPIKSGSVTIPTLFLGKKNRKNRIKSWNFYRCRAVTNSK
ncbi:MAG: M23 family metallopeptidase [Bacteroidetes bacterium]|nr:MAG: M23 family metallopeptidase [Bacteroidota bacterium]TAG87216.1 MAG: M23 family metallopeptidase [Bacteroidota bacterium]